jgi:hypothetical protein
MGIVRFCRCQVPIDYFVATWPLAANETRPPSLSISVMPMVLCKRVRINAFYANLMLFWTNLYGLFTCAKQLQSNSCQFCCFLLRIDSLNLHHTKWLLLKWRLSLWNEDSTFSPASGLTLCSFPWTFSSWYASIHPEFSSLFNNQPVLIGSLYPTDRVGCVFTQQFNSIVDKVAKYLPKWPLSPTVLVMKPTETILHSH